MITQTINKFLTETLPKLKIAVIGDIMVDRYVFGDVSRISPEAPVPVNKVSCIKEVLGGAANVAANLANLDCQVFLGGVAGDDEHLSILKNLLAENRIYGEGVYVNTKRSTTTKMRILGDRQQMLRLDFEEVKPISSEEETFLLTWLEGLFDTGLDGIVISDYGKGICTDSLVQAVIKLANSHEVYTIVDPKGKAWHKYDGATFITPNVKELGECVGYNVINDDEHVVAAAKSVLKTFDLKYVVATRSAKGITVVSNKNSIWHSQATQQEVFDVSGAGDTVVSAFLTSIAGRLSMRAALHVANGAAGIVVSKVGTYPIHRSELLGSWNEFQKEREGQTAKYDWDSMAQLVREWQRNGETVVFTNGCFDILHRGHVTYLQEAAKLGDHLIIGLNSDASVKRLKGETRPIVSEDDRSAVLIALGCVDGLVVFNENTPQNLLAKLRPNILVKGGDYKADEVIGRESVEEVKILPFIEGHSTTGIIEKVKMLVKEGLL